MVLVTRSNLVRISWLFLIIPLVIYGLLYIHCCSTAVDDRELHRRRLVMWSISSRGMTIDKSRTSLVNLGLLDDKVAVGKTNDPSIAPDVLRLTEKSNVDADRSEDEDDNDRVERVLRNLADSQRTIAKHKNINIHKNRDNEVVQHKINLERLSANMPHRDNSTNAVVESDDEEEDSEVDEEAVLNENKNAGNQRAVPALKVKRYADERIDEHTYKYLHLPEYACRLPSGGIKPVFVIFMVVTAPGNFWRRTTIRNSYGNEKEWPAIKRGAFKTVFLLGRATNSTIQQLIDQEADKHRDIVQEDFVDSYANLTLKTVMGLKWMTNNCRHANYMMKIDDDSMVNQGRFLWIFKNSTLSNWTAAETLIGAQVFRNNASKYYISEEYYPSPTYPPYLNGPGYIMSTDLGAAAYRAAMTTPLFPWEDVFLGTCLKKLKVMPIVHRHFLWISDDSLHTIKTEKSLVKRLRAYVVVSNLQPEYMRIMWNTCKIKIYDRKSRLPRHHRLL